MNKGIQLAMDEQKEVESFKEAVVSFQREFAEQSQWGSVICDYNYYLSFEAMKEFYPSMQTELKTNLFTELVLNLGYADGVTNNSFILAQYTQTISGIYLGNLAKPNHPTIDFCSTCYQLISREEFFEHLYNRLATIECGRVLLIHKAIFEKTNNVDPRVLLTNVDPRMRPFRILTQTHTLQNQVRLKIHTP